VQEEPYNTLEEELFALRFLVYTTKDEKSLKKIKERIKEIKRQIVKRKLEENENDKHKRK